MGEDLHSLAAQIVSAAENLNYDGEVEICLFPHLLLTSHPNVIIGGGLEQGLVLPQRPPLHHHHHDHHWLWTYLTADRFWEALHHPLCNGG